MSTGLDTPDYFEPETDIPSFQPLIRLNKDLNDSAQLLGRRQIHTLVDLYYKIQDVRKGAISQRFSADPDIPNKLINWLGENWKRFEGDVKKPMQEVCETYRVGQWLTGLTGIGPVLAAGLMSALDLSQAVTVGHWWSLCGLVPTIHWLGKTKAKEAVETAIEEVGPSLEEVTRVAATAMGIRWETLHKWATTKKDGGTQTLTKTSLIAATSRRPWSNKLKTLCYKCSDCFVKFCNHPKQYYGSIYLDRKKYETEKNERKDYADQAAQALVKFNYGKETEARKWYLSGKLPPAHIHARCMRYTVKLFLSHLHHVMHLDVKGVPPVKPYGLMIPSSNHRHFIPIPNFDMEEPWDAYNGKSLNEMQA